jgi:class 3 adenylate cyclase
VTDPLLRDAVRQIQDIVTEAKGSPLYREDVRRVIEVLERLAAPDYARSADTGYSQREATILFADLRGFSSIAASYPAGVVLGVLSRCFGMLTEIIVRHYGTIDKFMGDALMALFNAPAPQPDHVVRAAQAALGLQRAVESALQGRSGVPHFRVGVHTGHAVIGNVGTEEVRNFTAIGDAVNLASRLQEHAAGGEVVVSGPVREQLGARATVRPLGPVSIKGKDRPVEAFVLEELT